MHAFSVAVRSGIRLVETSGASVADADVVVVLLGGVTPSAPWFDDVAKRCRPGVAVLAVDQVLGDARDLPDLATVLDAFGVAEALVVGSGRSAGAALDLRRNQPDRVRSVLLIEPDGLPDVTGNCDEASPWGVEILCGDRSSGHRERSDRVTYVPGLDATGLLGSAAGIDAMMAALGRALRGRGAPSPAA